MGTRDLTKLNILAVTMKNAGNVIILRRRTCILNRVFSILTNFGDAMSNNKEKAIVY